jgi:hypothetical protein
MTDCALDHSTRFDIPRVTLEMSRSLLNYVGPTLPEPSRPTTSTTTKTATDAFHETPVSRDGQDSKTSQVKGLS